MGPGHIGAGMLLKPLLPQTPVWALMICGEALDLLTFGFLAAGLESAGTSTSSITEGIKILTPASIPWSHGLFMSLVWAALTAGIAWLITHDRRTSALLAAAIFSHWILDFIVHISDLPLFLAGSPTVGLGLWGSGPGLIVSGILDFGLFIGGIVVYILWRKKIHIPQRSLSS